MGEAACELCGSALARASGRFCCQGCAAVAEILAASAHAGDPRRSQAYVQAAAAGLIPSGAPPAETHGPKAPRAGERRNVCLTVDGMWCPSCGWLVESVIGRVPGVIESRVSFPAELLEVSYDPAAVSLERLRRRIHALGYRVADESARDHRDRSLLLRFGVAALVSLNVMVLAYALYADRFVPAGSGLERTLTWLLAALAALVVFGAGAPVLGRAWGALRARRLTMDSLIALGALSAYFYSLAAAAAGKPLVYFDGACGLIAFRLLGRLIEQTAFRRASVAAEAVRRLLPRRARRIEAESGLVRWVPATDLRRGDAIRVAPGERLPVDGRVLRGSGRVSTAAVDGEPRPRRVVAGDLVPGGSSCGESALELEVEAPAAESLLSRIADHVARASGQRPGGRDLADALARRLLPAVLVLAAATVAGWLAIGLVPGEALRRGLSVLVVCCPCALGMAGPLARVIAGGTLARRGIIVRGEGALDLAATARAVVFDKTGTLTRGELRACAITVEGASEVVALEALAALEKPSDHPVARAVRASTTGDRHEVANAEVLEGRGVRGVLDGVPAVAGKPSWVRDSVGALASGIEQAVASEEAKGRTVVIVAWGEVQAAVSFGDALRPEAAGVTAQLAAAGLPVTVLSGDAEAPTARIACAVGAAEHRGGCRPEEKVSHLARIAQRTGARPIFVGDGINDAPALAASTGVAVATGTDFARETADVLLLRPGLDALPELVSIARRMRSVIRQNLAWAALYNVIAIPAAVLGHLDPILAAAAMVASSVLTTLNSTRLARHPRSAPADAPTGEPLWSCAP